MSLAPLVQGYIFGHLRYDEIGSHIRKTSPLRASDAILAPIAQVSSITFGHHYAFRFACCSDVKRMPRISSNVRVVDTQGGLFSGNRREIQNLYSVGRSHNVTGITNNDSLYISIGQNRNQLIPKLRICNEYTRSDFSKIKSRLGPRKFTLIGTQTAPSSARAKIVKMWSG